nr:hypothetical protein [Tanacetum cinerariifolium]
MNHDHTEELLKDLAEARKKKKNRRDSPNMPPGADTTSSTSIHNQESQSHGSAAPRSSKTTASAEYKAWTMTDIRLRPSVSLTPEDLQMDDDMDLMHKYTRLMMKTSGMPIFLRTTRHLLLCPPIHLHQRTRYSRRLAIWQCLWTGSVNDKESLKLNHKTWKVLHLNLLKSSILMHNVSKPLPLGGPPGQVTIQSDFFFNKDLEYLRYGSKGSRHALSISKMKAAYYPDVGLKKMVPDQMWIKEECKHTSEGDRRAIKTHMWILSVVRIEVFSMYGYDYMIKIVLRRADLNEHIIEERDFKYLYQSDFEDLYLLNLQGHLNHLPPKDKKTLTTAVNLWTRHLVIRQRVEDFQLGIKSYQTQLNLTKPRCNATGFEYKHDYTVIDSPRFVKFWDRYGVQMIMRFNKIHKFSDGTLHQIDEALDYWVKEFKVHRMNPGLNTRFWIRKDLDKEGFE